MGLGYFGNHDFHLRARQIEYLMSKSFWLSCLSPSQGFYLFREHSSINRLYDTALLSESSIFPVNSERFPATSQRCQSHSLRAIRVYVCAIKDSEEERQPP